MKYFGTEEKKISIFSLSDFLHPTPVFLLDKGQGIGCGKKNDLARILQIDLLYV